MSAPPSAQDLARLHRVCFQVPRPWNAQEFAALLKGPGVFLVGDQHGFAIGRAILDEAELLTLAVAPAFRRAGAGRRCLSNFESRARNLGAARAFLEVAADNPPARALYDAAGYRPCGQRPAYYQPSKGPPVDAVIMEKLLRARPD